MSRIGVKLDAPDAEDLLPLDQLVPGLGSEPQVVEAGGELGERTALGAFVLHDAEGEPGLPIDQDAAVAEVHHRQEAEHPPVELLAAVEVGDGQDGVVDAVERVHVDPPHVGGRQVASGRATGCIVPRRPRVRIRAGPTRPRSRTR
jgi:hypothetical protein